ncbi:hypothetical protein ACHAWF_015319 [Thalassiosira exigua]
MTSDPQTNHSLLQEYVLVSFVACLVIMFIADHQTRKNKRPHHQIPLLFLPIILVRWLLNPFHYDHDHDVGGHQHRQGHHHHDSHASPLQRQDAFGASGYNSNLGGESQADHYHTIPAQ